MANLVWLYVEILSGIDALFKYLVSETPSDKKPFEIEIKSIPDLRTRLRRCRHLTVYRKLFRYNHHLFIGNVDRSGCDIYHFKFALKPCLTLFFPAQVTKERLEYSSYSDNREMKKIFNFENGDSVIIVNRHDYPSSKDAEKNCITRAESRVGGRNYSFAYNNCESFVNWVFSGDNTSYEYWNAHKLKKMIAIIIDAIYKFVVFQILVLYEKVIYIFNYLFVRSWDTFSSFFKQRQQEKREGHRKRQIKEIVESNEKTFLDPLIDSDSKILGFESQCTYGSMVCGGTRFEDDIKRDDGVYERDKKQNYELQTNLANVAKERNCVALPCINYKDFKMQKCVNKDSTCCLGFDYGYVCGSEEEETMFQASDFFSGISYPLFSQVQSQICLSPNSVSYRINDSKTSYYCWWTPGSMVRRGTKLYDGMGFQNDRQNTKHFSFTKSTQLYDSVKWYYEQFVYEHDKKQSYGMQSYSAYVPEMVNFLIKSYVNVNDVHMTDSQVQTRVCMDSFSSLGGVYGCVYGSKLAGSFSSDSEYAATIGCTTFGFIGTAGGAVLGSLACQQLT